MEVGPILDELKYVGDGRFPERALKQAIAQRAAITPHLLRVLERFAVQPQSIAEQRHYMLHIYALFLLAQFREIRAHRLMVECITQAEDILEELLGDLLTGHMHNILASTYDGDATALKDLIENPDACAGARGAALNALVVLVARGVLARDAVMAYFRELLHSGLERRYGEIWGLLIGNCMDLYPAEAYAEIKQAFLHNYADRQMIDPGSIARSLAQDKNEILKDLRNNARYRFVEDCVALLRDWPCFNQTAKRPKKIGRNQPCPCGSGLKYKYCCLRTPGSPLERTV